MRVHCVDSPQVCIDSDLSVPGSSPTTPNPDLNPDFTQMPLSLCMPCTRMHSLCS